MNKNLALKLRAGTEGAAGTLVARSWWDPAITVGVTASLQPSQETPRLGLFLGIDQGVDVEYRKAVPTSRLQGVSHKALVSIPSTDARDSKTPDQQPFAVSTAETFAVIRPPLTSSSCVCPLFPLCFLAFAPWHVNAAGARGILPTRSH